MTADWRVLSLDHRDPMAPFEDIVRLIDLAGTATTAAYGRSDVVEALNEHQPAAVALAEGALVGAAVARIAGRDAHLLALALHPQWRNRGIGSSLLRVLDQEVIHHGAHRLLALVEPGQVGEVAFAHQGFERVDGLHLYVRSASMVPEELEIVERYGGSFPAAGLWEDMKGFSKTKELLERRIVDPLAHLGLADRVGLRPPAAVMLFGPPGTGKTSFARAMASRLSWAFVELHPSLLGQGTEGAAALRVALSDLGHVDRLVCFIDEADEIAAARDTRPESQPLVNELLKAIPMFKSRPARLMVMATNSIAAIDPAMLRPGRFDLIIPVGAPDREGRAELAAEFLQGCDPDEIAGGTVGFTPADFALAAQRAAQRAFERALAGGDAAVTSVDCADAVARTRPSVHAEAAKAFEAEAGSFARL
ncbi:MAG TPA: bifunctional GNAT family N-acetyltransferase/ATP-binding protein [Acidimicrobiales bacterium]|nr:bifunctional GNAT family N-acetyltransferase/ATP-binding protein [Acidimicrobiales bacterium]